MNMVVEVMKSSLSKYAQPLKERIANLEKQLDEKDKLIAHLQVSTLSQYVNGWCITMKVFRC